MGRLSEQLEREAKGVRNELAGTLDELRRRMTPGRIVDDAVDYAHDTPVAEFLRNLARDTREHPLPLLLIGAGIAWLIIASSLRQRAWPGCAPDDRMERVKAAGSRPASAPPGKWEVAPVITAAD
jgi:hypothetical protein